MKLKLLLLLTLVVTIETLQAQDIHYSLFNMSPLSLNPAQTGAFSGTARIGGIYRDQWGFGFLQNEYTTPSISLDAPIVRGFRKNDWVGVGFLLVNDGAGSARMKTSINALSASYHLGLGKKSVLTLGIQGGSTQRMVRLTTDNNDILFEEEIAAELGGGGLNIGSATERQGDRSKNFLDFNAGLMLRTELADKTPMELGFTVGHVNTPEYALSGGGGGSGPATPSDKPMRITAHGRVDLPVDDKWSVTPTFLFQTTSKAREIAVQAWGNYLLNPDVTLRFGTGYRVGDSAKAMIGGDWKDLRVALAYDLNVSSNPASVGQGGLELAAWYILKIYKKPVVKPAVLCPRF